ncbi:mediator-associated protein 2 [Ziziphus jujuba]|uniref:Mediator-associated protein 2 n=1 Tax=Ziziphus jujuba TaxID=326968 RepID=A0ABM3IIC1_ZIZJJ|nr:mediator-associated protein 2 [Ziziphus jujuba]
MEEGYIPPPEFQEDAKEPLIDLSLNDSTELWLIQWPKKHNPGFDGQEVTFKLHHDGKLASLKGSSDKEYDVVGFAAQEPNATVFAPSASGTKIVGKISRRVSLVRYPDPHEVEKINSGNWKQIYQNSAGISSRYPTPARSTATRSVLLQSANGRAASSRSSRHKSSLSEHGEPSKPANGKHVPGRTKSTNQSIQDSGRGHSTVTSSGSAQPSHQGKEKKRKKTED